MQRLVRALPVFLAACALPTGRGTAPDEVAVAGKCVHYTGNVRIAPAQSQLAASLRITFMPDTTRQVRWLLNSGLTVTSITGPHVQTHNIERTDNGQTVVVKLRDDTPIQSPTTIDIAYAGIPRFGGDTINGISPDWVELGLDSDWHPVFAGYEHRIVADVAIELPRLWPVVTGGATSRHGDTVTITNRNPMIDIAFAAAPQLRSREAAGNAVFYTNAPDSTVTNVLTTAAACADYLNDRYGDKERFPPARILLAPRGGPGYARQNYIVITHATSLPPADMARFICHEFAHFWSIGAISSGPENWLNEGFAEYVSARFVRARHGDVAYNSILNQWREQGAGQPPLWTPALTRRPTARMAYRKAPYLLHQLEERVGAGTMDDILEKYMEQRIGRTAELLHIIAEEAGQPTATWFASELGR
jgi:hypothetical protein